MLQDGHKLPFKGTYFTVWSLEMGEIEAPTGKKRPHYGARSKERAGAVAL